MLNKKIAAALLLLLMPLYFSFAEDTGEELSADVLSNKDIVYDELGNEAQEEKDVSEEWQYLEWEEDDSEFVLQYEIIIEQKLQGSSEYVEVSRLTTEGSENKIRLEPLLEPGIYRYKIITYNLIGIAEVESDWIELTIYKAYEPEITDISSNVNHSNKVYLEELNDGIFIVTGKNLFEPKDSEDDVNYTEYELKKAFNIFAPKIIPLIIEHDENNKKIKIQLDVEQLDKGTYYLVAKDASGLKSKVDKSNSLTVQFKKRMDLNISAGAGLLLNVFDGTLKTATKQFWQVPDFNAKVSFVPLKYKYGYFGFGAIANYTPITTGGSNLFTGFLDRNGYNFTGNVFTGNLTFNYQLPVYRKLKNKTEQKKILQLELHAGAGAILLDNLSFKFKNGIESYLPVTWNFDFTAGAGAQVFLSNRLFIDVNIDYMLTWFDGKNSPDYSKTKQNTDYNRMFNVIIPSVGIGWQF